MDQPRRASLALSTRGWTLIADLINASSQQRDNGIGSMVLKETIKHLFKSNGGSQCAGINGYHSCTAFSVCALTSPVPPERQPATGRAALLPQQVARGTEQMSHRILSRECMKEGPLLMACCWISSKHASISCQGLCLFWWPELLFGSNSICHNRVHCVNLCVQLRINASEC